MSEYVWVTDTLALEQESIDLIEEWYAYLLRYPQPEAVLISTLVEKYGEPKGIFISHYDVQRYLQAVYPDFWQAQLPPLSIGGGYDLTLVHPKIRAYGYWKRQDGAILYSHRWWSTTSPPEGNWEYAWFQIKNEFGSQYAQVSPWKSWSHYLHKRRYWQGEIVQGSIGPYRPTYSVITEHGELGIG